MSKKEKMKSLTQYIESLRAKIAQSDVPAKHKNRKEAYKEFLQRELDSSVAKLAELRDMVPSEPTKK